MIALYIVLAVIVAAVTSYVAAKNSDFCKFLSGAFLVSAGVQFYLYLADVSVPLLGTRFVQTPTLSAVRSVPHLLLFLITLYFGFIKKRSQPHK